MIRFEQELRGAAEEKSAFVLLDYLVPEVQAEPVTQALEAGIVNLPGAGAFRMQDADAEALAEAIVSCNLMARRLELPNHAIGDAGAIRLAKLLTNDDDYPTQVRTFNLQGNQIGSEAMYDLAEALGKQECRVDVLNLSWNPIGREGIIALIDGLAKLRSLRSLYIDACDIDTVGMIHFAAFLSENSHLRLVHMDRPLLQSKEEDVPKHMSEALKVNRTLTELSMRKHDIRDLGASLVADALFVNQTLKVLDLSCNTIGLTGAEALASALMAQHSLEALDLSHNPIGDHGATALSAMLANNRSIQRLRMCFCNVASAGLCEIAKGIRSNSSLQLLRVWGNDFSQETLEIYDRLLREYATITGLLVDLTVYKVDALYYAAQRKVEDHSFATR